MNINIINKLEISEDEKWLIVKALQILCSDTGIEYLRKEFPNMDGELLGEKVDGLLDKLAVRP